MKNPEEWIKELEKEVSNLKEKNRTGYIGLSLEMNQTTANTIKSHFSKLVGYSIEVKMCPRKKFDIVLTWTNEKK